MSSTKLKTGIGPQLKVLLLLPLFTPLLCILIIFFFLPFYIYRSCISLIAGLVDPQISKVLTGLSASLLRDYDTHQDKPWSTIVVCLKGHGPLTLAQLREKFRTNIVYQKDPSNKKSLLFPELQQYYKTFLGYVFLKWDVNFELKNHVKLYNTNQEPVTRQDLMRLWEHLMIKPFSPQRSPWEAILVNNFVSDVNQSGEEGTVILLRIHHGIADGFAVQRLLCSVDDNFVYSEQLKMLPSISSWQRTLVNIRTVIRGPYDLLFKLLNRKEAYHSLHLPADKHSKEYFVVESPVMCVDDVKQTKNIYGVAFTSVLLSIVSGGVRRFLIETDATFPQLQCLGIPFATSGHSAKLGNDFLIAPLTIPIHMDRVEDRIYNIEQQFKKVYTSSISQMLGLTIDLLSLLPVGLMRSLTKQSMFSTAYSTIPGPMKHLSCYGAKLDEANFTYGTGAASLGLCFSSITFQGRFRMTIYVDKNLVKNRKNAEDLIGCVTKEYYSVCKTNPKTLPKMTKKTL